jgi:FtsP/CotA-like multicopper oxidase with cupredoxin domain
MEQIMTSRLPAILTLTLFAGGGRAPSAPDAHSPERAVRISINDNRVPAGIKRANLLTLHLVTTTAMWYPNGDDAPGAAVQAFAEERQLPRIPGPLIRVRAGTEVLVSIRNAVAGTNLTVYGLDSRTPDTHAKRDTVHIEAGATRTVRFHLDAPGTYYYWGTTSGRTIDERTKEDAQLAGAIIVDPATGPIPKDRVMVIGMWADTSGKHFIVRKRMLVVLNGLSWPHTERLRYTVGDTVHWRLINGSADSHPMHLHGFYYLVDSRGDGAGDTVYAKSARDQVVTDLMKPGVTMSMTWSPDRGGNWLFHCHLPVHFSHRGALGMPPPENAHDLHSTMNHATEGMSGLVTGVIVKEAPHHASLRTSNSGVRRQLRLVIRPNATGTDAAPNFEFALDDGRTSNTLIAGAHSAPPLVLTRGEPVRITVLNTLSEATAVHWHGIELESYYDGVAGFSGNDGRISPVIAPADSFIALFTPPRSGTFIYHTHIDEERQQPAGLAGPIIVLEPGQEYNQARDFTVVASSPRNRPGPDGVIPRVVWLNGSATPEPHDVQVGQHYRIRFINMTTGVPGLRFELAQDEKLVEWRVLAKDGADLPADRQRFRAARQPVSIGETADVEFIPLAAGDHELTARIADGRVIGTLVIRASRPKGLQSNLH